MCISYLWDDDGDRHNKIQIKSRRGCVASTIIKLMKNVDSKNTYVDLYRLMQCRETNGVDLAPRIGANSLFLSSWGGDDAPINFLSASDARARLRNKNDTAGP